MCELNVYTMGHPPHPSVCCTLTDLGPRVGVGPGRTRKADIRGSEAVARATGISPHPLYQSLG